MHVDAAADSSLMHCCGKHLYQVCRPTFASLVRVKQRAVKKEDSAAGQQCVGSAPFFSPTLHRGPCIDQMAANSRLKVLPLKKKLNSFAKQ